MKLLVIRHGVSENWEVFAKTGRQDKFRPLIPRGRKRVRKNFEGLKQIVPTIDVIATSPLTRAIQTAEILEKFYKNAHKMQVKELEPEASLGSLLEWVRHHRNKRVVALVGHEPHLSQFISKLINGHAKMGMVLKRGAVGLVECNDKIDFGRGSLIWLLQPRILRSLLSPSE